MAAAVGPDISIDHIKTSSLAVDVLRKGQILADVRFVVDNTVFEAHKIVLAAASPVFLAMFKSGMKESLSSEIFLTDTDPEAFEDFLKFVYCGVVPDMKHVVTLFDLSDKYHILSLFDACVAYLEKTLNEVNVSERLQLADLHSVSSLKNACLELIWDHFESVSSTAGWACVSNDLHITTLVAQSHPSLPVEAVTLEKFNVIEAKEALCYTHVKTVEWSIKWATVLNSELLKDPGSPTPIITKTFDVESDGYITYITLRFFLCLTKKQTKKCGTKVEFWLKMDPVEKMTAEVDCLAILHSAIPTGEYRRRLRFVFKNNKNPKKSFTGDRKILSFLMSDSHFSVDNSIKLTLIFQRPRASRIFHELGDKGPQAFSKLARTSEFSDVSFDVNGTEFHAHRIILACHSNFFKELFKTNQQNAYCLKEIDPATFTALLNFMYRCEYPEPQFIKIDLLQAAAEFSLVDLASYCSLMVAENVTVDNAIRLLKISQNRGAESLKEPVLKFIRCNMSDVIASAGWQTLKNCSSTVTELFLGMSRLRASAGNSAAKEPAKVDYDISHHFNPEIFEKDYD